MDEVLLAPYDDAWPEHFRAERRLLERVLPKDAVQTIEHAGSTAVPGLEAKPIIDIFIAVPRVATARVTLVEPITSLGYVYWVENPDPDAMFFVKGMPPFGERRTHHIHVMQPGTPRWQRVMLFRDYLRTHSAEAQNYLALKRTLAARYSTDREAYTKAKDNYIAGVVKAARAERDKNTEPTHEPKETP
ncbi:MAG: GrpB family protein [Hyphomicrobiales bacterium]|nr:MAG: GrpB family protein [Hyphomicrobiales bacterium]